MDYSKETKDNKKIENSNLKKGINVQPVKKKLYIKSKITFSIFVIIGIIVLVGIIVMLIGIFGKGKVNVNEKMDAYGFSKLYNSGTSNENENITRSEAIKMVVAATLNKDEINDMIEPSIFLENYKGIEEDITPLLSYKNQVWVEYAKAMNMAGASTVTAENEGENVTYVDIIEYFAEAKKNILGQPLSSSNKGYNVDNLNALYNASQQLAIKDMIENEIIENKNVDFKVLVTKKEMNNVIINFVNKYNTITVHNEKININPAKIPSNADEYPYTLASVDKKVYEYKNYKAGEEGYISPIKFYADTKKYYYAIDDVVNEYLNTILNVNYESLDENDFTAKLVDATEGNISNSMIKNYINRVKEQHIKITGNAKVQYPAIYFDGKVARVRTKIEYTIENADKLENVIFGDINSTEPITYKKEKTEMIIDIPVNIFDEMKRVFIGNLTLNDAKVENVKETIVNNNIDANSGENAVEEPETLQGDFTLNVDPE